MKSTTTIVSPDETSIAPVVSDPEFMTSLARGLQVIRAFGDRHRDMTVAQIAEMTSLSKPAVRRCLHTLVCLGYATNQGARYSLSAKILTLGYSYIESSSLTQLLAPIVENLMLEVNESCSASLLDQGEVAYIARSAPRRLVSVGLSVGSRALPFYGSMGRILLAGMSPPDFDEFIARSTLHPPTRFAIRTKADLKKEIDKVRQAGFSVVDQELEIGARAIAVPVLDKNGRTLAALNVGVPDARVPVEELQAKFLGPLKKAADIAMRSL